MAVDILDLAAFYATPLGRDVEAALAAKIAHIWGRDADKDELILGYGYAPPLAEKLWPRAAWHFLMPHQQGVMAAEKGERPAILTHEAHWPVRDDSVNRLLFLHGVEAANHLEIVLDEAWRVLRPNARALLIVPNRRGLWARGDKTPFGAGRPFSGSQLRASLQRTGFVPGLMQTALFLPPYMPMGLRSSLRFIERAAGFVTPRLGGVWLVEAVKQVPAPLAVERARKARARQRLGIPRPALPLS
jgi:SAM-dependent methyltransferase